VEQTSDACQSVVTLFRLKKNCLCSTDHCRRSAHDDEPSRPVQQPKSVVISNNGFVHSALLRIQSLHYAECAMLLMHLLVYSLRRTRILSHFSAHSVHSAARSLVSSCQRPTRQQLSPRRRAARARSTESRAGLFAVGQCRFADIRVRLVRRNCTI